MPRLYTKDDSKNICVMSVPRLRRRAPLPRSHRLNKTYSLYNKEDSTVRAHHYIIGNFSIRLKNSDTALPTSRQAQSRDFAAFKSSFKEAARDRKSPKTDQLRVLKNVLTKNAIHHACLGDATSIDHAWSILEEAYGDQYYRWSPVERRRLLDTKA